MNLISNEQLQLFEDQPIRAAWDNEAEEWYFSVVDVVAILTEQKTPRSASTYWAVLKNRLKDEGAGQLLTNCKQLKLKSPKDWQTLQYRCCYYRTTPPNHPINPLKKSRAF